MRGRLQISFLLVFVALMANLLLWGTLRPPSPFSWTNRDTLFMLAGMALSTAGLSALGYHYWRAWAVLRESGGLSGTGTGEPIRRHSAGWITALAIVVAGGLLLAGILGGEVKPIGGALLLLLGSGALFTIIAAAERLAEGSEVEVSSHWGGLGGSLGGWRISQTAILLVLALILVSGMFVASETAGNVASNQAAEEKDGGAADNSSDETEDPATNAGAGDSNGAVNDAANATGEAVENGTGNSQAGAAPAAAEGTG